MAVALGGQVEHGVGHVQVRLALLAVCEAVDHDVAEDGGESATVAGFDVGPSHPRLVADVVKWFFDQAAQVQVVLVELAEQFTSRREKALFELGVAQRAGLAGAQEPDHLLEVLPARCEGLAVGSLCHVPTSVTQTPGSRPPTAWQL